MSETQGRIVAQVDPSHYRRLEEECQSVSGRLEIVRQVVTTEGDVDIDQEMQRKKKLGPRSNDVEDEDADELVEKLEEVKLHAMPDSESGEDEDDEEESGPVNRKAQKKQKKQSKKAKRREKEKQQERDALAEEELKRLDERKDRVNHAVQANAEAHTLESAKSCNTCGGSFANAAEYRAHFRSDWHRFNQKLKLKGVPPVSEQEFLLCDADTFFSE